MLCLAYANFFCLTLVNDRVQETGSDFDIRVLKGSESFCFDGIAINAKYYGHPTTKGVKKGQKRELYL